MGQPTTIVGVDYSGSKSDAPWLTAAVWSPGRIEFQSCEDIDRADLTKRLRTLPHNAIAAMDFPFGVPQEFALQLDPHASIMPHLWGFAATTEYAAFLERLQQFDRQPLRYRDRDILEHCLPLICGCA